jgi:hypothetical protein
MNDEFASQGMPMSVGVGPAMRTFYVPAEAGRQALWRRRAKPRCGLPKPRRSRPAGRLAKAGECRLFHP